ncbi:MAG: molybdate ABC transporter substrate-binding protein [Phormidesmis sp. CAN_BIN36]|nr:molybdate ABC transporter substrate-binding protein [Phormidesmis sp. CAN_BIN36]
MNRRRFWVFLVAILATFSITIGCQSRGSNPSVTQPRSALIVSAAASLKDALAEIKRSYQPQTATTSLTYNLGASGALMQQIQNGAPADVFISAAKKPMDILEKAGELLSETRRDLVKNRLVLIMPKGAQKATSFASLSNAEIQRVAIGEPRSVPAGQYAEQVLQKLKIYDAVKPKFVYANNVRQVLAAVESGNADAGIVYLTDANISKQVTIAAIASEADHSPIVYPIAVLKNSKNPQAAKEFVQFLESDRGKSVFKKYGFVVP